MNHRSKREVAPPPQTSSGSADAPGCIDGTMSASLQTRGAIPPPIGAQTAWWNGPMLQTNSFGSAPVDCALDLPSPGGYLNYFQTGRQPFIPPHVSMPPPWPPTAPMTNSGTKHATSKSKAKAVINIDDGDDVRTAKRLTWEPDEDSRLVSAWLFHSNDPINGNCKKNESYWADVVELYNNTTPVNRKREVKHLKDRWQKIKKLVAFFCASWMKATSIYTSGYSDDQLRDMALQFYLDDYKEGPFALVHCWKVLRDEPKWHAILEEADKSKKRSLDDGDTVTQEDIGEKERPMGRNGAKKQCNGKGKYKDGDPSLHEDMKNYMDIQAAASKRHEEFI
ncbi:hypothetical protein C2845_PM08G20560 [Panicum miliaceum]|uniref:Uncharacterized protein n=1 Tax=Panicum miliaceum TaxID=4540 RepID=A0A3L6R2L6_PANMI|nr:hypothetical protein C2845_PM08G20560 [Panicum miliaceum]